MFAVELPCGKGSPQKRGGAIGGYNESVSKPPPTEPGAHLKMRFKRINHEKNTFFHPEASWGSSGAPCASHQNREIYRCFGGVLQGVSTGAKTFENRGFGRAFLHSVLTQRGPQFRGGVQTLPIKIPHQLAPLSNKGTPSIFLFLKWVGCFRV